MTAMLAVFPDSGMFLPDMGTKRQPQPRRTGLADALFTPVQQRLLALLFGQPDRRFQSGEIIRLAESGTGAVHRQLARLAESGWISAARVGNQKYYQANRDCPAFPELHGLVVKTVGLIEPIREALAEHAGEIDAAFVYGSVARGEDRATSDVDLLVVSERLGYADVFDALQPAERRLGRTINPTVVTRAEWKALRAQADSFIARIAKLPRTFVLGSDGELA
jgi:predicted nucleotidyltransferase